MRPLIFVSLIYQLVSAAVVRAASSSAPFGVQWPDTGFVSAVAMDDDDHVHLVGSNCWWASLNLQQVEGFVASFGQEKDGPALCHQVSVDKHRDDTLWIAGASSATGGSLERPELEIGSGAQMRSYGFLLDVSTALPFSRIRRLAQNETRDTNIAHIRGSIPLGGPYLHTIAVAANQQHVYAISMRYENIHQWDYDFPVPAFESLGNPSVETVGAFAAPQFEIESYTKAENYTQDGGTTKSEGNLKWSQSLSTEDAHPFANVAGMLLLGDDMIVGGSTRDIGAGLGVSDGLDDMDGFITKLDRRTGALIGRTNETAGQTGSLRIETQAGESDYLYGMCQQEGGQGQFVYLVGSTTGNFAMADGTLANDGNSIKAYILRVDILTMEIKDAVQFSTLEGTPVIGLSCASTQDGGHVYIAGNVESGGSLKGSQVAWSYGGNDIFVAKVKTSNGSLEWIRQLGGPSDEVLAPRNGLVVASNGDVVLTGNTRGSLYTKNEAFTIDVFVALVSSDGEIPGNATTPTEAPSNSTKGTEAPTVAPSNTTEPPVNVTDVPTAAPTNATQGPVNSTMIPTETPTQAPDMNATQAPLNGTIETETPTVSPLSSTTEAPSLNGTDSFNSTVVTETPTNAPSVMNATLPPLNDTNSTFESNAPTVTPANENNSTSDTLTPTVAPINATNSTFESMAPTPMPADATNSTFDTLVPTMVPINATNSTYESMAPSPVPNNSTFETMMPTMAPVNSTNTTFETLVPTIAPMNATNSTFETMIPTLAPTNATDSTFETIAPTAAPTNTTNVTFGSTEPPTYAPTNATQSPTTTPGNATTAPTNITFETEAPTPAVVPQSESTSDPATLPPGTKSPTIAPTTTAAAPTDAVESKETLTVSSFDFDDLTIRLSGASAFSANAQKAFEEKTALFYRSVYVSNRRRRLSEEFGLSDFGTVVTFKKDAPDETGNTVTYHQTVFFASKSDNVTEKDAEQMIVRPFESERSRQDYVALLAEGDDDFKGVSSTDGPRLSDEARGDDAGQQSLSDDDSGSGMLFVLIIVMSGLVCCCLTGFFWIRRKGTSTGKNNVPDQRPVQATDPEQPHLSHEPSKFFHEQSHDVRHGRSIDYGMSYIGKGNSEDNLLSESLLDGAVGSGPTAGFGSDFDHPEKRRIGYGDADRHATDSILASGDAQGGLDESSDHSGSSGESRESDDESSSSGFDDNHDENSAFTPSSQDSFHSDYEDPTNFGDEGDDDYSTEEDLTRGLNEFA